MLQSKVLRFLAKILCACLQCMRMHYSSKSANVCIQVSVSKLFPPFSFCGLVSPHLGACPNLSSVGRKTWSSESSSVASELPLYALNHASTHNECQRKLQSIAMSAMIDKMYSSPHCSHIVGCT